MSIKLITNLIISFLVLLLSPSFSPAVYGQSSTVQSQMLNMELKGVTAQNSEVTGTVALINNSGRNFAAASLITKLASKGGLTTLKSNGQDIAIQNEGQLINFSKSDPFALKPGERSEYPVSVKYPPTVQSGSYILTVQVVDSDGTSQGITSQDVELSGSGTFLEIKTADCKIKIGSKTFSTVEGPSLGSNDTGTLSCIVKNTTGQRVQAKPQAVYAIDSVSENAGSAKSFDLTNQVAIGSGQVALVSITFPKQLAPQVYEGLFSLADEAGREISPKIPFRWIVTGPSAAITSLNLDKSYYKSGDTAKVSVSAVPSVDLSWRSGTSASNPGYSPDAGTDLIQPKLTLKITNSDNQICGQKEEKLPSTKEKEDWEQLNIDIPITAECKNPKVEAGIYEEGITEPLALLTKGSVTTQQDLEAAAPKIAIAGEKSSWLPIAGAVILLILLAGAGAYLYWKKKKSPPGSPPVSGSPDKAVPASAPPSQPPVAATMTVLLAVIAVGVSGYLLKDSNYLPLAQAQQQFAPLQGTAKPFSNSTDESLRTITMKKMHERRVGIGPGPAPIQWANVRDFSQNNTGGDSSVEVGPQCKYLKITVRGTAGSDYVCGNWGPGIAIANFVDNAPISPTEISSPINNQVIIPSIQVGQGAFNDYSSYGPHIINVHDFGRGGQKSVTYTLKLPNGISEGRHKLLLQAGPSQATFHGAYDRYYSTLEPVIEGPQFIPGDLNCEGKAPCFTNLERDFSCGPPPACNQACGTNFDCEGALNGCTQCRPNPEGQKVCQPPPPACDAACASDRDCFGGLNGCTACVAGQCRIPPACGVRCSRDDQCAGARDGCTACVSGVCKVPPACGVACTTKADCTGARDGCTECLEGTCTNFNDQMCKCDGMIADIAYPSTSFNFEAFGKVEGTDIKKAEIADITFRMTKDNQVVAKSNPITPSIVENTASKVRFKAAWSTPPPPIDKNSVYRVFADVRCKPKRIVASNGELASTQTIQKSEEPKLYPPKGLEWVIKNTAKLFGGKVNPFVSEVLAQLSSPSPSPSGAQTNLQLQTLNFVKLMDTDNCRFVMFKFDEALF